MILWQLLKFPSTCRRRMFFVSFTVNGMLRGSWLRQRCYYPSFCRYGMIIPAISLSRITRIKEASALFMVPIPLTLQNRDTQEVLETREDEIPLPLAMSSDPQQGN